MDVTRMIQAAVIRADMFICSGAGAALAAVVLAAGVMLWIGSRGGR